MNLHLTFSKPTPVQTDRGIMLLSEADPTPAFWGAWKKERFEDLLAYGVSLVKKQNRWVIQIYRPLQDGQPIPQVPVYQLTDTQGLYPWQRDHVAHLVAVLDRHGAVLDGSDTGTGKTYGAVATARERGLKPLVVAPRVGMRKWRDVCAYLRVPFRVIVGWEEAKTQSFPYTSKVWGFEPVEVTDEKTGRKVVKQKKVLESIRWKSGKDDLLIFDEAHRSKGYITQNARMLAASEGTPTLLLSATLADSPRDMWAAGSRLHLHSRSDFGEFCKKLFCFKAKKGWAVLDRNLAAAALHKLIYPEHGSRIRVKELGDAFPQNHLSAELMEIAEAGKLNDLYSKLLKRVEELEGAGHHADVLVERMRFRQAAELLKVPGILEMAEDYQEEGNGVAIFVCFRETLDQIKKHLGKACAVIYGGQSDEEREDERVRFENNEVPYICAMVQAGGISCDMHDLKGKPRVSLVSPCDNATQVKQVLGRIHRAGALSPARQIILFAAGTVEEKVYDNVAMKIHAIDIVNDGDLIEPALVRFGPAFTQDQGGE